MVNHPTYRVKILKNRYQHLLYLGKAACLFLILQKYTDLNRFRNQNKYFKRPWKSDRSLFLLFELKTVRFLLQMSSLVWLKSQKVVKWKKTWFHPKDPTLVQFWEKMGHFVEIDEMKKFNFIDNNRFSPEKRFFLVHAHFLRYENYRKCGI